MYPLILACFFASGASGLIFEVLWSRMLGHVFGATSLAVATVLATFMGGLAIGAHFGGRMAGRVTRPVLWYAGFEALIALYALCVPTLLQLAHWVQVSFWPGPSADFLVYSLIRFAVVVVILLPPSALMGATLPLLAEAISRRGLSAGRTVGLLYATNTVGAVVGAACVGFVLIPNLGVARTNLVAVGIDLLIAAALLIGWRWVGRKERSEEVAVAPPAVLPTPVPGWMFLAAVGISGGVAMALQVLWTRGLTVVLGSSTYAFTIILVVFLTGLAGGATVAGRFADRDRMPAFRLGILLAGAGLFGFMGSRCIDQMPHWLQAFVVKPDLTIVELNLVQLTFCGLVMLPSTLMLGGIFPYVIRGLKAPQGLGDLVGRAYAVNTIGAIVGAVLAGFVIIPQLTVFGGLLAGHELHLLLGWLMVLAARREGALERSFGLFAAVSIPMLMGTLLMLPWWNVSDWSLGMFRISVARSHGTADAEAFGKLIYHADGLATTVTVERADGVTVLKVNGKVDASSHGDMPTQVLSGLLPIALHQNPQDVAVIGWGSGVTAGAALDAPIRRLDMIELEREVVVAGRYFAEVNQSPELDPRTRIIYDDGRNFMAATPDRYDIIISEPSNPWMAGASALFTEEFFTTLKGRLRPDGISLQWIQLYELSGRSIKALMRTYAKVFPHILVIFAHPTSNDVFLIGSREPLILDRDRLEAMLQVPALKASFNQARVFEPVDLLPRLVFGAEELRGWVGEGPINTDDNALIEFEGPLDLLRFASRGADLPFMVSIEGRRHTIIPKYTRGWKNGAEAVAWGMARGGRYDDARQALKAMSTPDEALVWLLDKMEEADREPVLVESALRADRDYGRAAQAMLDHGPAAAESVFLEVDGLAGRSPAHRFLAGYVELHAGEPGNACDLLERASQDEAFREAQPAVLYYLARALVEDGKPAIGLRMMAAYRLVVMEEKKKGRD